MSVIGDLRAVSGDAVTRLAVRFSDLPRPVLAAIGAGDFLVEQVAELREAVGGPTGGSRPGPANTAGSTGATGPDGSTGSSPDEEQDPFFRAQRAAGDLAAEIPERMARLTAEFPERVADLTALAGQFSPDVLRETVEAYGHLAGTVYSALAVRGRRSWSRARAGGGPGSVVDASS